MATSTKKPKKTTSKKLTLKKKPVAKRLELEKTETEELSGGSPITWEFAKGWTTR